MTFNALGPFAIIIPIVGILVGLSLIRSIRQRSISLVATVLTVLPILIGGVGTFMGYQSVTASAGLPTDVIANGYLVSWQTTYLGAAVSACLVVLAIFAFLTHSPSAVTEDQATEQPS